MNAKTSEKLTKARYSLSGRVKCAAYTDRLVVSEEKGLRPMLLWLEQDPDFLRGACVADKVVGKAAAMIMIHAGVKEVFAEVIGRSSVGLLEEAGIEVSYINTCIAVANRRGDGLCPNERLVAPIKDPAEAYTVLRKAVLNID